jgi:cytochrome c
MPQQPIRASRRPATVLGLLLAGSLLAGCQTAPPGPEEAAKQVDSPEIARLLRANDCFKCHTVERDKDGPSWASVAAKYRDKADAEERLFRHLTTAPIIDLKGDPEKHKQMDAMQPEEVRKIVRWIVAL